MSARVRPKSPARTSDASMGGGTVFDPRAVVRAIRGAYREAVDPTKAPGKVKQFTPEEIAALNAKVRK